MDALLPNSDLLRASELYGKYRNIREKTVRLYGDVCVQYYLLKGSARDSGEAVFSILCVETDGATITDSEFVFDITTKLSDAEHIYAVLCRNTVTPCCLFDVLDSILYNMFN